MKDLSRSEKVIVQAGAAVLIALAVLSASGCREDRVPEIRQMEIRAIPPAGLEADPDSLMVQASIFDRQGEQLLKKSSGEPAVLALSYSPDLAGWTGEAEIPPEDEFLVLVEEIEGELPVCYGKAPSDQLIEGELPIELRRGYRIGEQGPAGGLIFYRQGLEEYLADSWCYLEAAGDQWHEDSLQDPTVKWGNEGTLTGADSPLIGTGLEQTQAIMEHSGGIERYAARLCDQAEVGGADDWFLPSEGELLELIQLLETLQAPPVTLDGDHYWSSSEMDADEAFLLTRGDEAHPISKIRQSSVRPVRRF